MRNYLRSYCCIKKRQVFGHTVVSPRVHCSGMQSPSINQPKWAETRGASSHSMSIQFSASSVIIPLHFLLPLTSAPLNICKVTIRSADGPLHILYAHHTCPLTYSVLHKRRRSLLDLKKLYKKGYVTAFLKRNKPWNHILRPTLLFHLGRKFTKSQLNSPVNTLQSLS